MALLNIHNLSMQFGGLRAVNKLDLDVAEGSIFSVIGPNGAGKTTVFNAITGIYDPTEGEIRFSGHPLRRPWRWQTVALCVLIGLFTSLAAATVSLDVDQLWRATILRNMHGGYDNFSAAVAWSDFSGYLHGCLAVERRTAKTWAVVPWNSSRPFLATAPTEADARQAARALDDVVAGKTARDQLTKSPGKAHEIADADTIAEIARRRISQARWFWVSLIFGLAIGVGGTAVFWYRSRRSPDVFAAGGIARTFQNIRLFSSMTVLENVQVGTDRRLRLRLRRTLLAAIVWLVVGRRSRG